MVDKKSEDDKTDSVQIPSEGVGLNSTKARSVGFKNDALPEVVLFGVAKGGLGKKAAPEGHSYKTHGKNLPKDRISTYVDTEEGFKIQGRFGTTGDENRPVNGRGSIDLNIESHLSITETTLGAETINMLKDAELFMESADAKKYMSKQHGINLSNSRGERAVQITKTQNPNECLVVVLYEGGKEKSEQRKKFKMKEDDVRDMAQQYRNKLENPDSANVAKRPHPRG